MKKYLERIYVVLGFICLILGAIGAIMPVMPTVPFLFVAYFFFKRGSKNFRRWYERSKFHKQYQKSVNWFMNMPMARKLLYLLGMGVFFGCLFSMWYFLYVNYFDHLMDAINDYF